MRGEDRDAPAEAPFPDSHAHLSLVGDRAGSGPLGEVLSAYDSAWETACSEGREDSAPKVVDPGVRADDLRERVGRTGRRPWLLYAAGIWPGKEALEDPWPHLRALEAAAALPECAAVGEGGLDYHWMHGSREAQRLLFEAQIDLAVRLGKPLIVHSRDAHRDTLGILSSLRPGVPVVIHCFGYDADAAREFLDLGCWISFAGNLTYPASSELRKACALVPADRLLLETDSPYMAPEPFRGKPCTPLRIRPTYEVAAALRGEEMENLARTVSGNLRIVFG